MPTDKPRVMLTLDPETHDILNEIGELTDLTVTGIIGRFLGAHVEELAEYYEWLKKVKNPTMKMLGKNLLQSYGPNNLIDGIRSIDPKHEFMSEKFKKELRRSK